MFLQNWFSFESAKERKKKEERYFRTMFPLGREQKTWEIEMIAKLLPREKDTRPFHYELLILREALIKADDPDRDEDDPTREDMILSWEKNQLVKRADPEIKNRIKAMALLEHACTSQEMLPTVEAILDYAKKL